MAVPAQSEENRPERFAAYIEPRRFDPPRLRLLSAAQRVTIKDHALDAGVCALNATKYLLSAGFARITALIRRLRRKRSSPGLSPSEVTFVLSRSRQDKAGRSQALAHLSCSGAPACIADPPILPPAPPSRVALCVDPECPCGVAAEDRGLVGVAEAGRSEDSVDRVLIHRRGDHKLVARLARQYGITLRRSPTRGRHGEIDRDWLYTEYVLHRRVLL
jgi:hypothetical protein